MKRSSITFVTIDFRNFLSWLNVTSPNFFGESLNLGFQETRKHFPTLKRNDQKV